MKTTATIALHLGCIFLLNVPSSFGQESKQNLPALNTYHYKNAVGVRFGETSGLTIKHFTSANKAIEGIVGVWYHAVSVTVLSERYAPAFNTAGFNWYYGIGGHVAIETDNHRHYNEGRRGYHHYHGDGAAIGVDGILGLEYKIQPIPFALSLDMKPFMEVTTNGDVYLLLDPGLGIKFTF
jgi:hypothetical protein